MKCPRCGHDHISTIAKSPVEGAWEIYECDLCYYSWRSTENPVVSDVFKLKPEEIPHLQQIPAIPPLDE